jgi:hypothetical protein
MVLESPAAVASCDQLCCLAFGGSRAAILAGHYSHNRSTAAIISAAAVDTEIVQSVRWRRQYELSIDRLVRTSINGKDSSGMDVSV